MPYPRYLLGYYPTEYAEFTEPPTEMSSHGFLLRRVWHLAIPTPPAIGYSPTEYAEFTEPPAEMFSHGIHRIHRIWQRGYGRNAIPSYICAHPCSSVGGSSLQEVLCVPCSSVGGSSLPEVSVRSVRSVGISFLPRISQIYTDTYGALFSHRIHRIHRIWQRGYGRDAIPSYICEHLCHPWESFLCKRFCEFRAHLWESFLCQKFLCVPCVLWESLSSHGFHRFTQMLRVRCSPTEFTEFTEFGNVGMAGMPYPPNL